jgi:hypothetical protein
MSRIVKLIWRLDFKPSYAYIDKRGTALNLLTNTVENFWATVGDGIQHMSFVAKTDNEKAFRTMSIEPTNMNGSMEWTESIELNKALQTEEFKSFDKIAKEMLKVFEIKAVARAGVRCFCVAPFADGKRDSHARMLQHVGKTISAVVESKLGPVDDTALIFEGQTPDKVRYRLQYGPYDKKNVNMVLEHKPTEQQLELLSKNDLFFDIDLFETEISFAEHSLYRWANTKISKAVEVIAATTKAFS